MKNVITSLCLVIYLFVNTKIYAIYTEETKDLNERFTITEEAWNLLEPTLKLFDIEYKEIEL